MKKTRMVNPFGRKDYGLTPLLLIISLLFSSCSYDEILDEKTTVAATESTLLQSDASSCPTITAYTDQPVGYSGRNDMAVLRNFFFSGSICEDNLTISPKNALWNTESAYANNIGAHGMRSINGERGCSLDAYGKFIPSPGLKTHLTVLHARQWDPHIVVGQQKPAHLPGRACHWTAGQWDAYEKYAYECLKFIMNDYKEGFDEAIIEVSNEVDIAGAIGYWFVDGNWVTNGDVKAYNGLIKCYAQWSDAVKRFNKNHPGKRVKLFGAGFTVYTMWWWKSNNWATKLIEDCKRNNWQLDAVAFHQYGAEMLGSRPDYSGGRNPKFESTIKTIQDKLNSVGFTRTEIWMTEWGCSTWFRTERLKNNYRPVGGAFAAAFMHIALNSGVDGMVPLRLRDPNGTNNWTSVGSLATNNGIIYPKPIYNVFRMFYQMPGTRKKAEWKNSNYQLGAIASSTSDQAGVLVYNYDWDNAQIVDRSLPHDVQVKIVSKGLTGTVKVKRYLMDNETSNLAKYVDAGRIPSLQDCELQMVEEYTAQSVNGTITLKTRTLGKSAVSLWLVSK